MTREDARQEIRSEWRRIIPTMTGEAKQKVNGKPSYICPLCGHGTHGDGLCSNPRSTDGNGLHCFGCGFSGDIIDLYQQTTGADYNTALSLLADELRFSPPGVILYSPRRFRCSCGFLCGHFLERVQSPPLRSVGRGLC